MRQTLTREEIAASVRAGYDAFNRGDLDGAIAFLAEDVSLTRRAEHPLRATFHGRPGARRMLAELRDAYDEVRLEPERLIHEVGHVIVLVRQRARVRGLEVDARLVQVWEFDGTHATSLVSYPDLETARAAMRGPVP